MPDRSESGRSIINNPDASTMKAALDSLRETFARMSAEAIVRPAGMDPAAAAGVVIGSLPMIAAHREAIASRFGEEGSRVLDALPTAAYALRRACFELQSADDDANLREMHAKILAHHTLLVTDADALVNRSLLDRARVDAGRSTQGYETTVDSTGALLALFQEKWATISEITPLTEADLVRIDGDLKEMLRRLNEREHGTSRLPASETRARALSHLVTLYSEARRMITFVRWANDDADAIAPSLYSFRKRGKNASAEPEVDAGEPVVTPVTPSPVNGGGPFTQ